jgi:hypothetical protein
MRSLFVRRTIFGASAAFGGVTLCLAEAPHNRNDIPPFELGKPRHDEKSYFGRVQNMFEVVDPTLLLVSDEELKQCQTLIEGKNNGKKKEFAWSAFLNCFFFVEFFLVHPFFCLPKKRSASFLSQFRKKQKNISRNTNYSSNCL